jgi:cytochrome c oxidase cbb3-type subunit 3
MNTQKPEGQLLDHNYDGIQELDNPLPRWWVLLFYATILFAIGYTAFYFFGPGLSIQESFEREMAQDRKPGEAFTIVPEGKAWVTKGAPIFKEKCASCHGQNGEGLIGPNLTDAYWIHGKGTVQDIYKVVTKGVPEKGMIAWETQLKPEEMAAVSNYVHSLKGSNPANAKPPQGEKAN